MAPRYAKDEAPGFKNHIEKIAIVGAGGRIGAFIVSALLESGRHTITAITREGSDSKIPPGVHGVARINYDDPPTIEAALRGQDALIITMSVTAPQDQHTKLIQAAADARVPWIMPNEFGIDARNERLGRDTLLGPRFQAHRDQIERLGVSSWVSLVCGFWYEFSLAGTPARYGFDIPARRMRFFDDGATKINTTTWSQTGRAVARVFALKLLRDDERDAAPCLHDFANDFVYVSSFLVSQRDMFASVKRVTGTSDADWTFESRPSAALFDEGMAKVKAGDLSGWPQALYSRTFFPEGGNGNYEAGVRLNNTDLGLPEEDLDAATKVAVDMASG